MYNMRDRTDFDDIIKNPAITRFLAELHDLEGCDQKSISSNHRTNNALQSIKEYGYDTSRGSILVNTYGNILDGLHRTAVLLYLDLPIPYEPWPYCMSINDRGDSRPYYSRMQVPPEWKLIGPQEEIDAMQATLDKLYPR